MKKKGFTLIELLAVIVVLAIIALIATPIVMNVIKKANEGAAERSADNYVKAVETLIATNQLDGTPVVDGNYAIDGEGNISFGEVELSGTKPIGGTITIKGGQVVKDSSTINFKDHTVTFEDGVAKAAEAGELMTLSDCDLKEGTANTVGAKYTCDLGDGDRTFYLLETGSDPITNSTLKSNEVALILEGNFDTSTQAWCASGSDNACAADGLNAKLDHIVETAWIKLERSQIGIPSMEQIMVADGREEDTYLDYPTLTNGWLYSYPGNNSWGNSAPWGYWTSTSNAADSSRAWFVYSSGGVVGNLVDSNDSIGIRPVIILEV